VVFEGELDEDIGYCVLRPRLKSATQLPENLTISWVSEQIVEIHVDSGPTDSTTN